MHWRSSGNITVENLVRYSTFLSFNDWVAEKRARYNENLDIRPESMEEVCPWLSNRLETDAFVGRSLRCIWQGWSSRKTDVAFFCLTPFAFAKQRIQGRNAKCSVYRCIRSIHHNVMKMGRKIGINGIRNQNQLLVYVTIRVRIADVPYWQRKTSKAFDILFHSTPVITDRSCRTRSKVSFFIPCITF